MVTPRLGFTGAAAVAALTFGLAFAIPAAAALPGDDPDCQEKPGKTCTQAPPQACPAGTVPAVTQPPAGEGVACNLDSLVRARAKAEVLTHDELVRLCADVRVRQLVKVRVAVGKEYQLVTLDGKTCGAPTPVVVVPVVPGTPAPQPAVPVAQAPTIVTSNLPVTH